jgi:chromosome segregation ATPase
MSGHGSDDNTIERARDMIIKSSYEEGAMELEKLEMKFDLLRNKHNRLRREHEELEAEFQELDDTKRDFEAAFEESDKNVEALEDARSEVMQES